MGLPLLDFYGIDDVSDWRWCVEVALGVVHNRDTNEILLITRQDRIAGCEYSFPGGKIELSDDNEVSAAVREVFEEVGVKCIKQGAYVIAKRPHPDTRVLISYVYLPYKTGMGHCREKKIAGVFWKPCDLVARELDERLHPKVRLTLEALGKQF